MDWHNETDTRQLGSGLAQAWTGSNAISAEGEEPLKPTRGHKACIAELALRFPAARDVDQRQYQARLDYLAQDTAHLTVPLLRAACDLVARDAKGLPYASEIIAAAKHLVEERQRIQAATQRQEAFEGGRPVQIGDKAAAYAMANHRALQQGMRVMQTADGSLFKLGDHGERRGVRSDGTAIEPFFHANTGEGDTIPQGWYCKQDDVAALSRCYAEYGAAYMLRGAMIVERGN